MVRKVFKNKNSFRYIAKLFSLVILTILVIILSSCDYSYNLYHDNIRDGTEVTSVDNIYYDCELESENDSNKLIDASDVQILDTLESKDQETFLDDLSEIGGITSRHEQVSNLPCGIGIQINYVDSGVTIITVNNDLDTIFVGDYGPNYKLEDFYAINWEEMINEFIELVNIYFDNEETIDSN